MSPEPNSKPTTADRQNARALALNAAATLAAAELAVSPTDVESTMERWTDRLMHFITEGRWPE